MDQVAVQRRARSLDEFATRYGISRSTVKRMCKQPLDKGGIRAVKISEGRTAILAEEEERWLKDRIAAAAE
jgi:transposase